MNWVGRASYCISEHTLQNTIFWLKLQLARRSADVSESHICEQKSGAFWDYVVLKGNAQNVPKRKAIQPSPRKKKHRKATACCCRI